MTKPAKTMKEAKLQDNAEPMTEAEVQDFWQHHEVGEELLAKGIDADLKEKLTAGRKTRSRNITLNLNAQLERRLRTIAEAEGIGYQTLIKQFLLERTYQEEVRLGIVK